MTEVLFRLPNGSERSIIGKGGSIMQLAVSNGIDGIVAECGGAATCGTCHVYVEEGFDALPPINENEREMLDFVAAECTGQSRLSCQLQAGSDCERLVIRVPDRQV